MKSPKQISLVTFDMLDRTPGELTTSISAVVIEDTYQWKKREIEVVCPVTASSIPKGFNFDYSKLFDSVIISTTKEVQIEASEHD